jgi:hypothetical protein
VFHPCLGPFVTDLLNLGLNHQQQPDQLTKLYTHHGEATVSITDGRLKEENGSRALRETPIAVPSRDVDSRSL